MTDTKADVQVPVAVARFLEGLQTGDWTGMEQHFTPDAIYDGSMPSWRVQYEGPARITQELREEWTGRHPWRVAEHRVTLAADTVVLELEAHGRCSGDADHAAHEEAVRIANIFRLADGRIAEHRFYCCGEWDEETIRRIEREAPKVARGDE